MVNKSYSFIFYLTVLLCCKFNIYISITINIIAIALRLVSPDGSLKKSPTPLSI